MARRQATKRPKTPNAHDSPESKEQSERMRGAIVGFGRLGRQIAQVFAQRGRDVKATDTYPEALKAGTLEIENGPYGLWTAVAEGKLSMGEMQQALTRIHTSTNVAEA